MPSTMATNPLQALLRSPSSSPGGASSPSPGATPFGQSMGGGQLSRLFGQQNAADPGFLLKQLTQTRQMFAEMIPVAMVSVEGVAADLGTVLPKLDKVIEKLKKAQQAAMLARPPIGFSAASASNAPSGMGGAGMMPSGGGMGGGIGGGP